MNKDLWMKVQQKLQDRGFYKAPLTIDGLPGTGTRKALKEWQLSKGLPKLSEPDARQLGLLGLEAPKQSELIVPPWGVIVDAKMGLHEQRDKAALQAFLDSDGSTLGDPTKFPWCGDLEETALLNAGFGPVPSNPYLARNWASYGVRAEPAYYLPAGYSRPGPNGNEGHIGFIVGRNKDGTKDRVRGGNTNNQIGDAWILTERRLFIRKPANYKGPLSPLPVLDDAGEPISTNEA